jgi:hypothetical protein
VPNGPLSLPARLYLLASDTGRPEVTDTAGLQRLVRAGALVDLVQRGLLTDDDGIATPVDLDSRAGDAVLDRLLELVRESRPHRWRAWVPLHARVTLDAVREQLTAEGWLRAEKSRVLGVFPTVDYAVGRVAAVRALQEEAREVLRGPLPVAGVSERDAAVAALAAAADLRTLAPGRDRVRHRQRLTELTERGGAASPTLRTVVGEVRAAVSATVTPVG